MIPDLRAVRAKARAAVRPVQTRLAEVERRLYGRGLARTSLRLPTFLGIGVPQAGTTWLYDMLSCHPEIGLSKRKEVQYFDKNLHRSLGWYAHWFESVSPEARAWGEVSPSYCVLSTDRISDVRSLLPDCRLVLLLRNPVDRAWSAARRVFSQLAEPHFHTTPEDVAEEEYFKYFRAEHLYLPEVRHKHGSFAPGLLRGHYTAILDNWLSVFPAEQLLIGLYDTLRDDPTELLGRVFAHLGVDTEVDWSRFPLRQRVNQNPERPVPPRVREFLEDLYCPEIERVIARLGPTVAHWRCG